MQLECKDRKYITISNLLSLDRTSLMYLDISSSYIGGFGYHFFKGLPKSLEDLYLQKKNKQKKKKTLYTSCHGPVNYVG